MDLEIVFREASITVATILRAAEKIPPGIEKKAVVVPNFGCETFATKNGRWAQVAAQSELDEAMSGSSTIITAESEVHTAIKYR